MLVRMERQIDREIAADNKASQLINDHTPETSTEASCEDFSYDSEDEDEDVDKLLVYGPQPQIITNDLKSLDDMVS